SPERIGHRVSADSAHGIQRSYALARRVPGSHCDLGLTFLRNGLRLNFDLDRVADEDAGGLEGLIPTQSPLAPIDLGARREPGALLAPGILDRKSTRLNSSHVSISYAVFCLKKKKKKLHDHGP